jgi:sugar/nucleoside kinase (ribokinase family)
MVDYVIYGKIILDDIRMRGGGEVRRVLGGGGPQAVFGARVWSDSVGFLTRSGTDLELAQVDALGDLGADLNGWVQFADLPTPHNVMQYDDDEYLIGGGLITSREDWFELLGRPIPLPSAYEHAKAIHLVTEFPHEPMVETARGLQERGAVLSLEPLAGSLETHDFGPMLDLIRHVDIVVPDWPTASGVAGSDDPARVMAHWSALGPAAIAIRHGARGSYVWSRERDEAWHVPAVPVEVVDPTGAGNAYGGGWCVGWTESRDARKAGCQGAVSASILVGHAGLPPLTAELRRRARLLLTDAIASARQL